MKNVNPKDGYQVYQKFFTDLVRQIAPVVLWQIQDGKRQIHPSVVSSFKFEAGVVNVMEQKGEGFKFKAGPVFCYSSSAGVIFKTDSIAANEASLSLKMPQSIYFLEEPDIHVIKGGSGVDLSDAPWRVKRVGGKSSRDEAIFEEQLQSITLSEEDKLFADKREAPRARPKIDKIITCHLAQNPETSQNFKLFDLSRGGLGFLVLIDGVFKKGQHVEVTQLEGQTLDEPLIGEIMSVRSLAPEEAGWKVGIRFVDEVPSSA
jgi:hypothetical protein